MNVFKPIPQYCRSVEGDLPTILLFFTVDFGYVRLLILYLHHFSETGSLGEVPERPKGAVC